MLDRFRGFLNRPLAEDFSLRYQAQSSLRAGVYIFLFIYLFGLGQGSAYSPLLLSLAFAAGCVVSSLLANTLTPTLLPTFYDEDRWTVGKHALHVLLVLLGITIGNQLILYALRLPGPSFVSMYTTVTLVGFFPVSLGVFLAEQRRLKRNLARAQTLNTQLDKLHQPAPKVAVAEPELPKGVVLTAENGRDKLSLLPNQLVYLESVGNYVEVHWLNLMFPQKSVLRNTLKELEGALAEHPQFFRCHRAFIVNLKAVHKTEGNARGYQLTMSGSGQQIPVSRGYVDAFDARMATLV